MSTLAWHFIQTDHMTGSGKLLVAPGQVLVVAPPLKLCERGLHFSYRAIDALEYAPGPVVCRVAVGGEVIEGDDKGCCSERTCLWMADATDTLRAFARQCALDVAHLWDMPQIVRQYLEGGDESIRDAARAAAWVAARAAAWDAAWDAQNERLEAMLLALAPTEVRDAQ